MPLIEFGTTKTRTMHAEAATTAMMWRLQQWSILHPTVGTSAFCLYAINKSELEEEGSRPIWLDSSVGAVGREELIVDCLEEDGGAILHWIWMELKSGEKRGKGYKNPRSGHDFPCSWIQNSLLCACSSVAPRERALLLGSKEREIQF